jgi:hypothetical protein
VTRDIDPVAAGALAPDVTAAETGTFLVRTGDLEV